MVVTRRAAAALNNNRKPEEKITNDTTTTTVTTRKRSTRARKSRSPPPPVETPSSPEDSEEDEVEDDRDDNLKNITTNIKSARESVLENGSDQDNDIDADDLGSSSNDSASDENDNNDDSASSETDDNQQDESSEDEDQDDDDDDLDDLLNKAQTALRKQQDGVIKLDDDQKKPLNLQFPKLQPGVSVDNELYIKNNKSGIAKLSSQVVAVIDSDESDPTKNTKTLVALTKIKQDIKPPSRKERQLERAKTTGKGWFDMPLADVTPEIKRDLQILRMRHVLDRKRHYKKMGKGPDPKYFQMGTVIEGATEFFSARINKKDRKRTFAEEILAQDDHTDYYHRKYQESQERKFSGGKKHHKKLKAKRS